MSQKRNELDESRGELEEIGEAIHLASQADEAQRLQDVDLQRFEELLAELRLQEQLKFQSSVRRDAARLFKENAKLKSPQENVERLMQVALKHEEQSQIHMIGQRALDTAAISLALQNIKGVDKDVIQCEDELLQDSIEFINVSTENLELSKRLRDMDDELLELQSTVATLRDEILELKQHPEAEKGPQSERILQLKAAVNKKSGGYDFTRFLTQLLLMASEEDLNSPRIADLFLKCGQAADD